MPIFGRFMMAAVGLLMIWKIVNSFRTGSMTSRGFTFDLNEQPIFFSLGLAIYTLGALFCAWVAAGNTPNSFLQFVMPR